MAHWAGTRRLAGMSWATRVRTKHMLVGAGTCAGIAVGLLAVSGPWYEQIAQAVGFGFAAAAAVLFLLWLARTVAGYALRSRGTEFPPPQITLETIFLDHGIRVVNKGQLAVFSGSVRLAASNASVVGNKIAGLWWEQADSVMTTIPKGGEDRARIALDNRG